MAKKKLTLFFAPYAIFFSGTVFSKELLGMEQLVYNTLAEQLTTEQIQEVIRMNSLWGWLCHFSFSVQGYCTE